MDRHHCTCSDHKFPAAANGAPSLRPALWQKSSVRGAGGLMLRAFIFLCTGILLLGAEVHVARAAVVAQAAPCAVNLGGTMHPNVQAAVNAATANALIKLSGTCTGVQTIPNIGAQIVYVNKSVTLEGGYNPNNWNVAPDPRTFPTFLDAKQQGRVI